MFLLPCNAVGTKNGTSGSESKGFSSNKKALNSTPESSGPNIEALVTKKETLGPMKE